MPDIHINIPHVDAEQSIEITVTVNGRKKTYNYRVEILNLEKDCDSAELRVQCLQRVVSQYDPEWKLLHIGAPGNDFIPLTFQHRPDALSMS